LYSEDTPDGDISTPVRVNGQPVRLNGDTYFLSHGGTIRFVKNTYVVDWPTGESVSASISGGNSMRFMNLSFSVFPCTRSGYSGLMGNANGIGRDDFNSTRGVVPVRMAGVGNTGGTSEYMEKQRLAWLAKEFAEDHRITQATSLFDYPLGMSTFSFTDRSFPKVHYTMDDIDDDRRTTARRNCENNGISGPDLDGCIYDNAMLGLPPSRNHIVEDPTRGIKLDRVDGLTPNTNEDPHPGKQKTYGTIMDNQPDPIVKPDPTEGSIVNDRNNTQVEPVKEPVKISEPSTPSRINIGKPRSGGSVIKPSTPRSTTPKPKPSTPKPSTPKPSTGVKGKG
jgi:hypothetical protein